MKWALFDRGNPSEGVIGLTQGAIGIIEVLRLILAVL